MFTLQNFGECPEFFRFVWEKEGRWYPPVGLWKEWKKEVEDWWKRWRAEMTETRLGV
jgi:hypothetical protein